MIRIAICDGTECLRNEIKNRILKYSFQKNIDFSVDEYQFGENLLSSEEQYDLIYMDYEFGKGRKNGFEIAREIRNRNRTVNIIFLSSYFSVVFEAFEVRAFRFLLKPIDEAKFYKALDDFIKLSEDDAHLSLRIDGESHMIHKNEIIYIEGKGKNCVLLLNREKENTLEYKSTLASFDFLLNSSSFFRCHKSFIVNLAFISKYNRTQIELNNADTILISRSRYSEFSQLYNSF